MRPRAKYITIALIGVVRNHEGKYLLTDRIEKDVEDKGVVEGPDFWQLPGGGMEIGETAEEGTIRELKEETGLDIEIVSLLPKLYTSFRPTWQGLLIHYLCRPKDEKQKVILNHESSRFGWFTLEAINEFNTFPETRDVVKNAENIAKLIF